MNKVFFGDCVQSLRELPEKIVHTCVTSPPYFGLRDYGHEGQIGLEQTPDEYVAKLVEVFREVRRVLRDDGTLWCNLGDSYASGGRTTRDADEKLAARGMGVRPNDGLKPKDLIGIPWRVAFALQADGWYLRQDIIWAKPNPMPESVTDRCTKSHEYMFLLSKNERYYFDHEAIKEPAVSAGARVSLGEKSFSKGQARGANVAPSGNGLKDFYDVPETRNCRSVWNVSTKPYKGAHFATFPPDLITPCVLASTSAHGHCSECGTGWVRKVEKTKRFEGGSGRAGRTAEEVNASGKWDNGGEKGNTNLKLGPCVDTVTTGWEPACECNAPVKGGLVLDPFMGSGTTAMVSVTHGRRYIGCELNPAYEPLQEERIYKLFADMI